jgi:hypothetical protein
MKQRMLALGLAVAVNGVAFAALELAMIAGAEQQLAARHEPERVLISAPRLGAELAKSNCPGPKTL